MNMRHALVCECKTEVDCTPEDMRPGACYRCPGCQKIWGCLRPKGGGTAWICIDEKQNWFHNLVGTRPAVAGNEFAGFHIGKAQENFEVWLITPDRTECGGWRWCESLLPNSKGQGPFDTAKEAYDAAIETLGAPD